MRELLLQDPYSCTPVCHVVITLERLAATIGPAGGDLYVPMRITGGSMTGTGAPRRVVYGTDFATMYADEQLVHSGNFLVADPSGDILMWYDGPSNGPEGTYDGLLDGEPPGRIPCRLSVRSVSTSAAWRPLNRRPLLGVGSFDGHTGTLEFTVLSVTENDAQN